MRSIINDDIFRLATPGSDIIQRNTLQKIIYPFGWTDTYVAAFLRKTPEGLRNMQYIVDQL